METHEPVLLNEVLSFLCEAQGVADTPRIVDGTLGLGGYSEAILKTFLRGKVFGVDRDSGALRLARERLVGFGPRFHALHANFGDIAEAMRTEAPFDAFVFDLGVSNMQLTEADRGFSFQQDGPLDMRMDAEGDQPTAADVLRRLDVREMSRIFQEYGEERHAHRIAAAIENHRKSGGTLETTGELVALIRKTLPAPVQRKMGTHPARRVFQALRIFVNDELGELESMLSGLPSLAGGGCVVVIVSYHSLEDRIVKHRFRSWEKEQKLGRVLTRHPVLPQEEEMERNHKSRSAKLRAFRFSDRPAKDAEV